MIPFELEYLDRFQNIVIILNALNCLYTILHSEVLVYLDVVLFFDTVFGMFIRIDQSGIVGQEK